ncbi:MAG: SDR family NAD(P)-dependent oxidoreductase [Burkholderiaceae bacterium]
MVLSSFPDGFRALVVGARGAIGDAFVAQLQEVPHCGCVTAIHRQSEPPLDLEDEGSVARAAQVLRERGPFHLVLVATGLLHTSQFLPEKRLGQLHMAQMVQTFRVNTFGPALLLAYLTPLLARERAVFGVLSAKVGSIGDNRLGGWYSYRASKAALNMVVKTAAIELQRQQPNTVLVALHPGTVDSALSAPFRGGEIGRPARLAAQQMLAVVDSLVPADSGSFMAYDGKRLPW